VNVIQPQTDKENRTEAEAEREVNEDACNSPGKDIPARIENDMKFLNDSWANMMDDGEAEQRLLKELEQEHQVIPEPNDGFQQVTRRKKKQRKVASPNKGYVTRSKGGPSNPSQ
jgi:hypothetical protein